jgi:hypothetical protein
MHLEDLYRLLRSEHVQAQGIVDSLEEPILWLTEQVVSSPEIEGFSRRSEWRAMKQ